MNNHVTMTLDFDRQKKIQALLYTAVIAAALLLIVWFVKFYQPVVPPPPKEEYIEIDAKVRKITSAEAGIRFLLTLSNSPVNSVR